MPCCSLRALDMPASGHGRLLLLTSVPSGALHATTRRYARNYSTIDAAVYTLVERACLGSLVPYISIPSFIPHILCLMACAETSQCRGVANAASLAVAVCPARALHAPANSINDRTMYPQVFSCVQCSRSSTHLASLNRCLRPAGQLWPKGPSSCPRHTAQYVAFPFSHGARDGRA